jgi:nickel-dependent lactate racemase
MKNPSAFDFVQLRGAVASGLVEIPKAVEQVLENPLDFPAIDRALVPGDRVAVAVHESLPKAKVLVESIIDRLLRHERLFDLQIVVVLAHGQSLLKSSIESWLTANHPPRVEGQEPVCRVVCHDPDDPKTLEYIAASEQGDPIYLQRDLVEADFVIPVYRWLEPDDPRGHDPFVVLPAFADRATIHRHAKAWLSNRQRATGPKATRRSRDSGWLAGIQFALGVLANQEGQIAYLISGTPESVDRACKQSLGSNDQQDSDRQSDHGFDLVVVQLVDESQAPSWSQVASAAHGAERWLTPAGRIVVVANGLAEVTSGIGALASDEPDEDLQQMLLQSTLSDAFAAAVLRGIQSRRSVYVQSQVDAETLESLGFASIRNPNELERLMQSAVRVGVLEY